MIPARFLSLPLALLAVLAVAVGAAAQQDLTPAIEPGGVRVKLTTVATELVAPTWGTAPHGDYRRLFVSDQVGTLWVIDLRTGEKEVFLDLSSLLVNVGGLPGFGGFDERGFLGIAFHPRYSKNGLFYTFTSEPAGEVGTQDFTTLPIDSHEKAEHQTAIREWKVPSPYNDDSRPNPSSRVLLTIVEPQFNHNGGGLAFDHDGNLIISIGDGGAADDLDTARGGNLGFTGPVIGHGDGNGQQTRNVLGSILRIDPRGTNARNGQYGIPADNPFFPDNDESGLGGTEGCFDGFCDEIFAYGMRNPYRVSVDRFRGDVWTGDVGQNDIEEVNIVRPGHNYGWPHKEGSFFFTQGAGGQPGIASTQDPGNVPANAQDPIAEYDHQEGIAVVGGFVSRSYRLQRLFGRYVFGEFSRQFGPLEGRLFFLSRREAAGRQAARSRVRALRIFDDTCRVEKSSEGILANSALLGFGEDGRGELYALVNQTGVPVVIDGARTGSVQRIDSCHRRHRR